MSYRSAQDADSASGYSGDGGENRPLGLKFGDYPRRRSSGGNRACVTMRQCGIGDYGWHVEFADSGGHRSSEAAGGY